MTSASRLLASVVALLAGCVLGTTAHAGNIGGDWDPQFNATYSGTGFSGHITFFVPDPCLIGSPSTTVYIADGDACSGGLMSLVSANVNLYNWPNQASIITTITFAPPAPSPDPILGIRVQFSSTGVPTVLGLDTDPIGARPSGVGPSVAPAFLYLDFSSGTQKFPPLAQGAYLLPQVCQGVEPVRCFPDFSEGARSNAGTVTFRAVPEPGSLALLAGALGAGWFARRRKVAV